MKLLFLSIGDIPSINHHEIYPDLLREFIKHGHEVFIICARERRKKLPTELLEENGAKILKVRIGNITKTNMLEKGISTVLIECQFKRALKKYFAYEKFDMVMYSTPPITLAGVVEFVKKRDEAKSYLLLKDIFPQNAVDIGIMSKSGVKRILYNYFRRKERKLYALSDCIGCMSQANVDYVLEHNPEVMATKVMICPNCIEVIEKSVDKKTRCVIREKYGIPLDKRVFVYGGNLGKPQGIPFIIDCLDSIKKNQNVFFLIIGDGTEYGLLEEYVSKSNQKNLKLMRRLPKEDYDILVGACDVGMIFLDYRFTIPNFPSRLLSYMQAKIPVFALTDPNTDIGEVICKGGFGWWCESNDTKKFTNILEEIVKADLSAYGENSYAYLNQNYAVGTAYEQIVKGMR